MQCGLQAPDLISLALHLVREHWTLVRERQADHRPRNELAFKTNCFEYLPFEASKEMQKKEREKQKKEKERQKKERGNLKEMKRVQKVAAIQAAMASHRKKNNIQLVKKEQMEAASATGQAARAPGAVSVLRQQRAAAAVPPPQMLERMKGNAARQLEKVELERPGKVGWSRVVVAAADGRPLHVSYSLRHLRTYNKGAQSTTEFTKMEDLSEWLTSTNSLLTSKNFSFDPAVAVAGQVVRTEGPSTAPKASTLASGKPATCQGAAGEKHLRDARPVEGSKVTLKDPQ